MALLSNNTTTIPKILGSAAIAGLLLGGATGIAAALVTDAPERSDFTVSTPVHRGISQVQVHDPDDVLSPDDEARLYRDAERIETPDVVTQLHYIVFAHNRDNVNDSVEEYLRDNRPDLIGDKKFTDGTLFIGVGLDPRQAFVFAGEDVANILSLRSGDHLTAAIDAIKPGVKDNNIPAGLFAGASKATDTESLAEARYNAADANHSTMLGGTALGVGGASAAATFGLGLRRRSRQKKLAEARENLAFITREYGALGQRLDGIDIRAHSLTSALAHATMRAEWKDVRDRFLAIHQQVDGYGSLTASDDPKLILTQADRIEQAAETTRQLSHAEDNIEKIYRIEHGDAATRTQEIQDLRSDIAEAKASVKKTDSGLYQSLAIAFEEADRLLVQPMSPDFLDRYTKLLKDYQAALKVLREEQMSDVEDTTELRIPALYDADYRPGYGYMGFYPYWSLDTWHSSNVEAAQASSSSSSSSSYNSSFSSGFSGSGGSSGF